jgi:LysM repeat protein
MKLLNVFGLVVGAHLAVFTIIFATPGCRSTGKQKPKPEDTVASGTDTLTPLSPTSGTSSFGAPMSDAELNPGSSSTPTAVSPVAPVPPAYASSTVGVRFSPTRPEAAPVAPGAGPAPDSPTAPRATHSVAKGESLWSIAKKYGISIDELAAANQLSKSATLRLGQQLAVPAKAAPVGTAPDTDAANTYEVKSGDTLGFIARRQGTTVAALRAANNLSGDNLRVGQRLVIPGNAAPLTSAAAPAAAPAGTGSYTVIPGDTLGSIARKHGVKTGDLATLNTITDPAKLRVGQVLRLPEGARATPAPAAPAPRSFTPPPAPTPAPEPILPVAPIEEAAPTGVTPVEPTTPVEPVAIPLIRID